MIYSLEIFSCISPCGKHVYLSHEFTYRTHVQNTHDICTHISPCGKRIYHITRVYVQNACVFGTFVHTFRHVVSAFTYHTLRTVQMSQFRHVHTSVRTERMRIWDICAQGKKKKKLFSGPRATFDPRRESIGNLCISPCGRRIYLSHELYKCHKT